MKFFDKIREKRWKARHRLTPKGVCFKNYCELIYRKEWTNADYIEAYEEEITYIKDIWEKSYNTTVEREDIAKLLFNALNSLEEK